MRNFFQKRVWVILLATIALGSLTVLAVSLDSVSFRAAQRYRPEPAATLPPITSGNSSETFVDVPFWKQAVLWGLLALLMVLVGMLLSPESRKRFFRMIFRFAFTLFAISYLFTNYGERLSPLLQALTTGGQDPAL